MRLILATVLTLSASTLQAQTITGKDQNNILTTAHAQYYNLRSAGASAFNCNVVVDWDSIFVSVAGQPLPADNPLMTAFNASRLTVTVDLAGDGNVKAEWAAGTPNPSDQYQKSFEQMRSGLRQTVDGFYKAWFTSFTGGLIPLHVKSLTATPQGFVIDDSGKTGVDQITMKKNYLITHIAAKSDEQIADMDPAFSPSPDGLVMTSLDSTYQDPASAPPTHVIMNTTFQPVDGFRLPATLDVTVVNVAKFKMKFTGCTVQKHS